MILTRSLRRIGYWEQVKPGRFTFNYCAPCDPEPAAELGQGGRERVGSTDDGAPSKDQPRIPANFVRDFYKMSARASAHGIVVWVNPARRHRVQRASDFASSTPTARTAVSNAIREEGRISSARRNLRIRMCGFSIDRDRTARGL